MSNMGLRQVMRGRLCPSWFMIFISWLQLPRRMCFIEMDRELGYFNATISVYSLPLARTEPLTHELLPTHTYLSDKTCFDTRGLQTATVLLSCRGKFSCRMTTVRGHGWRSCQWSRRLALSLVRLGRGQVEMNRCEWWEGPAWLWPQSWASCDHRCV